MQAAQLVVPPGWYSSCEVDKPEHRQWRVLAPNAEESHILNVHEVRDTQLDLDGIVEDVYTYRVEAHVEGKESYAYGVRATLDIAMQSLAIALRVQAGAYPAKVPTSVRAPEPVVFWASKARRDVVE